MNEFKSTVVNSILIKGMRNAMLLFVLYLTSSIIDYSALLPFQMGLWEAVIIYIFLFVVQIFYTNNDLKIEGQEVVIQSSLLKGLRKKRFKKEEIKEIIFKDEWTESFMNKKYDSIVRFLFLHFFLMWILPWEYKWIQIKTTKKQRFTYYFFGMKYEHYNNSEEVLFEDMFLALARRSIKVRWNSTKDVYFKGIQEKADEISLKLNK